MSGTKSPASAHSSPELFSTNEKLLPLLGPSLGPANCMPAIGRGGTLHTQGVETHVLLLATNAPHCLLVRSSTCAAAAAAAAAAIS